MKKAALYSFLMLVVFIGIAVAISACPPPVAPSNDAGDATIDAPADLDVSADVAAEANPVDLDAARHRDAGVDSGSDSLALACENMVHLGCVEGSAPTCVTTIGNAQKLGIKPSCVSAATTLVKLRACSSATVAIKCSGK